MIQTITHVKRQLDSQLRVFADFNKLLIAAITLAGSGAWRLGFPPELVALTSALLVFYGVLCWLKGKASVSRDALAELETEQKIAQAMLGSGAHAYTNGRLTSNGPAELEAGGSAQETAETFSRSSTRRDPLSR